MNTPNNSSSIKQAYSGAEISSLAVYLPMILFLGFFFPNLKIQPMNDIMYKGRWAVLMGVVLLQLLISRVPSGGYLGLTSSSKYFLAAYAWIGVTLIYSVNPLISFVKWGVFLLFLIFCFQYSRAINNERDFQRVLAPFINLFIVIIWITPIADRIYYIPNYMYVQYMSGIFVFAPAMAHFFAIIAIPVILYKLSMDPRGYKRAFLIATIVLAAYFSMMSGSRTGASVIIVILSLYFLRLREGMPAALKVVVVLALLGALMVAPRVQSRAVEFAYKYPQETEILASRLSYWEATMEAFERNPLFGAGFGVQETMAQQSLRFSSHGFREQGSTIHGLLEETGLIGAVPLLAVMLFIGVKAFWSMLKSRDEVELLCSRVMLGGLLAAVIENYMLALGNALALLVFFIYMLYKPGMAPLGRVLSPAHPESSTGKQKPQAAKNTIVKQYLP